MDDGEAARIVIEKTVDVMEIAREVCIERQKEDGKEFSSEEPSVMEIVAVSNLIVNMTVAGMFKERKPDDWVPSPAAYKAFIAQIKPLVESEISLALSKERLREAQARSQLRPIPPPPPPPPLFPPHPSDPG